MREAGESAELLGKVLVQLPRVLEQAEGAAQAFAAMAQNGLRLDDDTIAKLAAEDAAQNRSGRWAVWLAAAALVVMAFVAMS